MQTEALHRSIVKNSDRTDPKFFNDLRQSPPSRISKEIWRKKNIAFCDFARKIDRSPAKQPPQFAREFFTAQLGQRHRALVVVERGAEKIGFGIAQAMIKMPQPVPADRRDLHALLKLGEESARHTLHAGVSRGTTRVCYVDEEIHSAGTCQ